MNLLLLADGNVGERVTAFLLKKFPQDVRLVVTTSDNAIAETARKFGAKVHIFQSNAMVCCQVQECGFVPDLGLLAWWPNIVKAPLLAKPTHGFVNFHPSLLPHCRGKHYNFWTLVEDAPFGVSLHFVDEGVDSGDVVSQVEIPYGWLDNGQTLYTKAQETIVDLFIRDYPKLRALEISRQSQDLSKGSFHRAAELESASKIDLEGFYRAKELLNLLRARTFEGYPACWFEADGETYEVRIDIRRRGE